MGFTTRATNIGFSGFLRVLLFPPPKTSETTSSLLLPISWISGYLIEIEAINRRPTRLMIMDLGVGRHFSSGVTTDPLG